MLIKDSLIVLVFSLKKVHNAHFYRIVHHEFQITACPLTLIKNIKLILSASDGILRDFLRIDILDGRSKFRQLFTL